MACRVGMTTNPEERKQYWKSRHRNFRRWTILSTHYTKSAAQKAERAAAERYGCESHAGGTGRKTTTWYVYRFYY